MDRKMTANVLIASLLLSAGAYAEGDEAAKGVEKNTFLTENGNTVEVVKRVHENDDGDKYGKAAYRVTDENGDVIARGAGKGYETAEGEKGGKHVRERTNADGETIQVRSRGHTDGQGNAQGQRQWRTIDADGDVVARGGGRGYKTEDGAKGGKQYRERTNADGETVQARRRAQTDGQGNVRVQRQYRKQDADGNVVARGSDRARKNADGDRSRVSKRARQNPNGSRASQTRRVHRRGS